MLKHLKSSEEFAQKNIIEKGFTLIELLVVIIILGILAAVVIFAIGNTKDNANKAACKTELSTIETAIAAYNTDEANTTQPSTAQLIGSAGYLKSTPKLYSVAAGAISLTAKGTSNGCATSYS